MIYLVLWGLIGLVGYFAGFKIVPCETPVTRREAIKWSWAAILMGPLVILCLLITYYDLETKLANWLDEEI